MARDYHRYPLLGKMPPRLFHIAMWAIGCMSAGAWWYFRVIVGGLMPNTGVAMESIGVGVSIGLVALKVMMLIKQ